MAVDAPQPGATVTGSAIRVGGWALQDGAVDGPGTTAVHVWAYPVGGAAPVLVGAGTMSVERPDVAALLGGEFLRSGFVVNGTLPAGTYDLVIAVHNARTGIFDQHRVVRVVVR